MSASISFGSGGVVSNPNGDGEIDFGDFMQIARWFGDDSAGPRSYAQGNLNGDHVVDMKDFLILSMNFGKGGRDYQGEAAEVIRLRGGTSIPEPSGILLLATAAAALAMHRRPRYRRD